MHTKTCLVQNKYGYEFENVGNRKATVRVLERTRNGETLDLISNTTDFKTLLRVSENPIVTKEETRLRVSMAGVAEFRMSMSLLYEFLLYTAKGGFEYCSSARRDDSDKRSTTCNKATPVSHYNFICSRHNSGFTS